MSSRSLISRTFKNKIFIIIVGKIFLQILHHFLDNKFIIHSYSAGGSSSASGNSRGCCCGSSSCCCRASGSCGCVGSFSGGASDNSCINIVSGLKL